MSVVTHGPALGVVRPTGQSQGRAVRLEQREGPPLCDSLVAFLMFSSFFRVPLFSSLCTSVQGFQMSITTMYLIFMFYFESRSERLELCSLIFIFHIQHLIKASSDLLDHIVLLVMSIITTKV
jgi:hypothetical protein